MAGERASGKGRDGEDADDNAGTSFVVDLELTRLGDLRIDGKVQKQKVDLIIRTRNALPDRMRAEIYEVFTQTLARTGIEGRLGFRAQPAFPPLPIEQLQGYDGARASNLHI